MATNNNYTTAGLVPDDNGADAGTNYFYITAGIIPDDMAMDCCCCDHENRVLQGVMRGVMQGT